MNTNINREGNADDILYAEEAAAVLGLTEATFRVARSSGYAPKPIRKHRGRIVFRRGDLWAWLDARAAGRTRIACGIAGCHRVGYARTGYCPEHAKRVALAGGPEGIGPLPSRPQHMTPAERFKSYTEPHPTKTCVLWVGADHGNSGYGQAWLDGHVAKAHVAAYELATGGPVPEGLELDHECGERQCVRIGPGHVVAVTHAENQKRMAERLRAQKAAASRRSVPVDALLTLAVERPDATLLELWETLTLPEAA